MKVTLRTQFLPENQFSRIAEADTFNGGSAIKWKI